MSAALLSAGKYAYAEAALNSICQIVERMIRLTASKKQITTMWSKIIPSATIDGPKEEPVRIHTTVSNTSANEYHGQLMTVLKHSSNSISLAISKLKSDEYLLLRARTAKALGKYKLAIRWLEMLLLGSNARGKVIYPQSMH